ncbi:MAG: VOC family protein, partial [Proteobacteria bacterium]
MFSIEQAKQMARTLRVGLQAQGHEVSHSSALEMVARQLGHKDWN